MPKTSRKRLPPPPPSTAVEATMRDYLADLTDCDERNITTSADLADDLGCDSLDVIEVLMFAEEKFDFYVPESDGDRIKTFGHLIAYIELHRGEGEMKGRAREEEAQHVPGIH